MRTIDTTVTVTDEFNGTVATCDVDKLVETVSPWREGATTLTEITTQLRAEGLEVGDWEWAQGDDLGGHSGWRADLAAQQPQQVAS